MFKLENEKKLTDTELEEVSGGGGSWFSVNFNIDWSQGPKHATALGERGMV
jgi:bacteriocin-like protein